MEKHTFESEDAKRIFELFEKESKKQKAERDALLKKLEEILSLIRKQGIKMK